MEAALQAPVEPLGFSLGHSPTPLGHTDLPEPCPDLIAEHDYLRGSQFSPNGASTAESTCSTVTIDSTLAPEEEEEEECMVDSQPICFKENPFLVANRKGKSLPPGERILSGPPTGYGKQGQLQPWLFSKARRLPA